MLCEEGRLCFRPLCLKPGLARSDLVTVIAALITVFIILLVCGWLLGKLYFSSISVLCSKTIQGWVLVEEG